MSDRLNRFAPLTGVLFAVLVLVAIVTSDGETPAANASAAKVLAYYSANRSSIETSSILFAIAFLVVIFFAGSLRSYLRLNPVADGLATLVLAGAVLMSAGAILGSGLEYGLAHNLNHLDRGAIQALNVVSKEVVLPVLAGGFVFGISSGLAILRGGTLHKALGWAAIVIGIAVLVPPISFPALIAFVIWTIVVSILIFVVYSRIAAASRSAPAPADPGLAPAETSA